MLLLSYPELKRLLQNEKMSWAMTPIGISWSASSPLSLVKIVEWTSAQREEMLSFDDLAKAVYMSNPSRYISL